MRTFAAKTRVPQQSAQAPNELVQRPATDNIWGRTAPASVHKVLRSSGHPLDSETRAFMESRFRHDFSRIRVHPDSQAADSARELGARAYTVGQDIAFAQASMLRILRMADDCLLMSSRIPYSNPQKRSRLPGCAWLPQMIHLNMKPKEYRSRCSRVGAHSGLAR